MGSVTPLNAAGAAFLAGNVPVPGNPVLDTNCEALAELLRVQLTRPLTDDDYRPAMEALGLGKRRIQQILKELRDDTPAGRPARFELTDHHKATILACKGNVSLAYRQLTAAGHDLPDEKTFWRRWRAEPSSRQGYGRRGAKGFSEATLYLPYEAPHRNAVWQADHFELPVDVIADGCTKTRVKPWLTLFEDDRHRLDMAWHLTAEPNRRPDAETVSATLAAAIQIRLVDGVEVGGVPGVVRWDNDKSFLAGMVGQLARAIGFDAHPVPPFSGHMKGKVERLGKTVEDQFCVLQPGFTHGAKTWTNNDPARGGDILTADELRTRLTAWFHEYRTRVHSSLGTSPLASWAADDTPLRRASDDKLRSALLVDPRKRTVQKQGVHFASRYWASAETAKVVGRKVTVHYPAGADPAFIEVYLDGQWLATAWPARHLTDRQRKRVFDERQESYAETRRLQDLGTELRDAANAVMGDTDATPSVGSMPDPDPIAPDTDALYALLAGTGDLATKETS